MRISKVVPVEKSNTALWIGLAMIAVACAVWAIPSYAFAQSEVAPKLTLEQFLDQVKSQHEGFVSALTGERGAEKRKNEYKLITRPKLFGSFDYLDSKKETGSIIQGDQLTNSNYEIGVSQAFDFGLQAQLAYKYGSTELPKANTSFVQNKFVTAGPVLSLSQPLLRGGFGRSVRANKEQVAADAMAAAYRNDWQQTTILQQAEDAYWRLALAREALDAAKENLSRSQRLRSWSSQRQKLQLADRSDLLQSDSSVLNYRLSLQTAINDERVATRTFNTTRGVSSDEVPEQLVSFERNIIDRLKVPERVAFKSDVLEEEQKLKSAQARAVQGTEANQPKLDLVGSIGYNGRDVDSTKAVDESFGSDHPEYTIGVRLEIPLDVGTIGRAREGYRAEKEAAQSLYNRKVFEQERSWNDLTQKFKESIERYKLAAEFERAQKEKLEFERVRHSRGRTTTYQVIAFEQDFASAELARIRSKNDILTAYSQLKTFAGGNQ